MEKYIYKIENLLNHKKYIGQTNDPKRRFREHKSMSLGCDETKVLYLAIKKYGVENFSFEIIEKTPYYNEREKYWISHYDSFRNGYNMTGGGENPPVFKKEEHPMCEHTQKEIDQIIFLLKNKI
jgi:group I intron endonuclease